MKTNYTKNINVEVSLNELTNIKVAVDFQLRWLKEQNYSKYSPEYVKEIEKLSKDIEKIIKGLPF